jgi:hypothetical protein
MHRVLLATGVFATCSPRREALEGHRDRCLQREKCPRDGVGIGTQRSAGLGVPPPAECRDDGQRRNRKR